MLVGGTRKISHVSEFFGGTILGVSQAANVTCCHLFIGQPESSICVPEMFPNAEATLNPLASLGRAQARMPERSG